MPHPMHRNAAVIVLALLPSLSCRDATAPQTIDATYVAVTVNGAPLPATVSARTGQTYAVLGDTLVFNRNGQVTRITVFEATETHARSNAVRTLHYTIDGDWVVIGAPADCGPFANCVATSDEGWLSADNVRLTQNTFWPAAEFVFARWQCSLCDSR